MVDDRKISIAIPTYCRVGFLIDSFAKVIDDDRVSEIIIVDDCSPDSSLEEITNHFVGNKKVSIYKNEVNLDCYANKREAVYHCKNDWCILLDSDNVIDTSYIDTLYSIPVWDIVTVYQPTFARPHFDFRLYSGILIDRERVYHYINEDLFTTALNAANFFINKQTYLRAFDPDVDPVTSDSIYMAYRLLKQGSSYLFVPGLEYEHRVGHPSHYTSNVHRTPNGFHQSVINKLATL